MLEKKLKQVANKIARRTFNDIQIQARKYAKSRYAEHLTGHVQLGIHNYIAKEVKRILFS